jgi:hypothetical protein
LEGTGYQLQDPATLLSGKVPKLRITKIIFGATIHLEDTAEEKCL